MELLVPIKDKNSAILAINLGADALYCSGPAYSARKAAAISYEDLSFIISYAHFYNRKVYITLNTLIQSSMFSDVIKYIDELIKLQIDALIIQDLGLLNYLSIIYPDIELHSSTQMHIHNTYGVRFVKNNGVSRVVVPREMDVEAIKVLKDTLNIEVETFIHGALCTSYSGQCYYSAFNGTGSGNFGSCIQNCRKQHSLEATQNDSLLSLKDLGLRSDVSLLSGVSDSLKIEGRLKGLNYLYSVINYYRKYLDGDKSYQEYEDLMRISYNREYTSGLILNNNDLYSNNRVNNKGLYIGDIIKCDKNYITIKILKPLYRLDNIRIIDNKIESGLIVEELLVDNKKVEFVNSGIVKIKNKHQKILTGSVWVVNTRRMEAKINDSLKLYVNKIELNSCIDIKAGFPIRLDIDGREYYSDFIVEKAKNARMDKEDILKQINKISDTGFIFNFSKVNIENDVFMPKSLLNKFKRSVIDAEYNFRVNKNITNKTNEQIKLNNVKPNYTNNIYMVRTLEQAKALVDLNIRTVFVDNVAILKELESFDIEVIPVLPRVIKEDKFNYYYNCIKSYPKVMVSELGMLDKLSNNKILYTNFSLNIINEYALSFLKESGVTGAVISFEAANSFGIEGISSIPMKYGYLPLMIMDYCPINRESKNCESCTMCISKQYYLYNEEGNKLPLVKYGLDMLELYSHKPVVSSHTSGLVSFVLEDYNTTLHIIKEITY